MKITLKNYCKGWFELGRSTDFTLPYRCCIFIHSPYSSQCLLTPLQQQLLQ